MKGCGLVFIDEIDLHLHPKWQRDIVPKLERVFPNCQFVLSIQSPQVLSHVKAEQVWLLNRDKSEIQAFHPQVTFGLDSSRILEEVMNVPKREPGIKADLSKVFREIEEERYSEARILLNDLRNRAPNIPEYSRADALLKRKELLRR